MNWCVPYFTKVIYVGEYVTDRNFGDALNYVLLSKLTNRTIIPQRLCFKSQFNKNDNLLFIGSIIRKANSRSIVWGAGIISHSDIIEDAKEVLSVRGPITRTLLLSQGIKCPAIYGDPALLLPRCYCPENVKIETKVGFIPHFLDKKKSIVSYFCEFPDVKFIDIQMPKTVFRPSIYKNYKRFVNDILSCKVIISSCLHGLIIADAYGKPSLWVKFGDDIGGDDVKFYDYYESLGIPSDSVSPVEIYDKGFSIDELIKLATVKPVGNLDMSKVIDINPFPIG